MWQGQKNYIGVAQFLWIGGRHEVIGERSQLWMDDINTISRPTSRHHRAEVQRWMPGNEPQEFAAGIARGAEDRCCKRHRRIIRICV